MVPKKWGKIVVKNENNERLPTRRITSWRICIDFRKLNKMIKKDNFLLPFINQNLDRIAGNEYFFFLDGYSMYNQIVIASKDQEKTTFTFPYDTFTFKMHDGHHLRHGGEVH